MQYLFVHGLGQNAASWDKTLGAMRRPVDFSCPELPEMAVGKKAGYPALYQEFSRYCGRFPAPFHLCGLSLGGVLSLHYCIDHPQKVRSLVLIGTQYKMPKRLLKLQNALFYLMPASAFRQTGFGKEDFLSLCRSMAKLDFSQNLPGISCPALVVCGERDRPNQKAAEGLAKLLPGADLQKIPGAGHEVNVDQPQRLAKALDEFYAYAAK